MSDAPAGAYDPRTRPNRWLAPPANLLRPFGAVRFPVEARLDPINLARCRPDSKSISSFRISGNRKRSGRCATERTLLFRRQPVPARPYIFELLYPSLKGQAIFTVPTRALANDKLAEWRDARMGCRYRNGRSRAQSRREGPGRDVGNAARSFSAARRSAAAGGRRIPNDRRSDSRCALRARARARAARNATAPAQRQRAKSAGCRRVVSAHRTRPGPDLAQRASRSARGNRSARVAGIAIRPDARVSGRE